MDLQLITPPEFEVFTDPETGEPRPIVLDHVRTDWDADKPYLLQAIAAAREVVENHDSTQLLPATWQLTLPGFPAGPIELPRRPVRSITAINYIDPAGAERTLDEHQLRVCHGWTAVRPAPGKRWPATQPDRDDAVAIVFEAGFDDEAAIPPALKQAMLLLIGDWFARRENSGSKELSFELSHGTRALLAQHCTGVYR